MSPATCRAVGALLAAAAVALGAFGAHGLKSRVERGQMTAAQLETFETAVRYHLVHALGLVLVGLAVGQAPERTLRVAATLMLMGVLLFSGLLYAYLATHIKALAMIVPLGGLALITGWLALAVGFWQGGRHPN